MHKLMNSNAYYKCWCYNQELNKIVYERVHVFKSNTMEPFTQLADNTKFIFMSYGFPDKITLMKVLLEIA